MVFLFFLFYVMLWNVINLCYRSLSIIRWNNYPRIEEYKESEHISFKLNLAYFVVNILKEKWESIDLVYIYKNIFWNSFFSFIYSDIQYDIKTSIKKKDIEIYKELRRKLKNFFIHLDLDERFKKDFESIFDSHIESRKTNKKLIEQNIINFVKVVEKKLEIKNNIKFYSLSYNNILKELEEEIEKLSKKIWFEEMELLNIYSSNLVKLKFAYRWNKDKRTYPISVLSHLFFVFCFSYILWTLKNFSDKDLEDIFNISLLHDLPEALTWDVITPTKNAVPWFRNILEEIEEEVVDKKLLKYFKKYKFKSKLKYYTLFPFESSNGKIAKYADQLSAMFEAKIECNIFYDKVYKNIKNQLWLKNDKELDYILKYGVDYFDEDIEQKWKKFIWLN